MNTPTCTAPGCDRPVSCKGYCPKHYVRWRKYGDPLLDFTHAPRARTDPARLFWEKVDKRGGDDACWPWTASLAHPGHGQFVSAGKHWTAHRFAYVETYGPVPDDLDIHHICGNRVCCNPAHLVAMPRAAHRRMTGASAAHAAQTHCIHGHPLSGDNVYLWRGARYCRTCRDARNHARSYPNAPRTHCAQGHPLDEANTYVAPNGGRHCRECKRQWKAAKRRREGRPARNRHYGTLSDVV